MGLIINDKIQMFIKGYPTVSDKYNVSGAVLEGTSAPVNFGELVMHGDTKGYFKKASGLTDISEIGGIVLATNVKVANEWPGTSVTVNPGEAFNLLVNGFIAVELDTAAVEADVLPNAQVYATTTGAFTTVATGNIALTGTVFTGMVELHGTTLFAEVYVK